MSTPPITRDELHDLLRVLLPGVPVADLNRAAHALHLIFKAGKLAKAVPPAGKPKVRQYREKSVAESLHLKLP